MYEEIYSNNNWRNCFNSGVTIAVIQPSYFITNDKSSTFTDVLTSGPLSILGKEFKLGETIFLHIRDLGEEEQGAGASHS